MGGRNTHEWAVAQRFHFAQFPDPDKIGLKPDLRSSSAQAEWLAVLPAIRQCTIVGYPSCHLEKQYEPTDQTPRAVHTGLDHAS
jgi:hypothetical protein